jgi:uncharacterized membrane protein
MAPPPSTKTQLDSFLKDPRIFPFFNYALLFFMVVTFGATGILALLIANFREDKAPDWIKTHYEFQKRTFWLSIVPILACAIAAIYLKGHGIQNQTVTFALVVLPLLYVAGRCITGFNHLLYNRAYPTPKGWMI